MFTFNHSGKIGDLLYSLYFCKSISQAIGEFKFNFHIQTNVPEIMTGRQHNKIRLTEAGAKFIQPLLKIQPYINNLTISDDWDEKNVQNGYNLDAFRQLPINFHGGFIIEWYYNLTNLPLRRDYESPMLIVESNKEYSNKIILLATERYFNPFVELSVLKPYQKDMIFIGLENEYNFVKKSLDIPRVDVKDALEVAQILKGAKLVISNQNGNFTIAELINANRILISPHFQNFNGQLVPGPANNVCHGGWFEYANTSNKLEGLMKYLIK